LIHFVQECLENTLRFETWGADASSVGDDELASLFEQAQDHSRKGAEIGKRLLCERLQKDLD
jgi:hypothetical protein